MKKKKRRGEPPRFVFKTDNATKEAVRCHVAGLRPPQSMTDWFDGLVRRELGS